jgi:hypothetical protein
MYLETINTKVLPVGGAERRRYPRAAPDDLGRFNPAELDPDIITVHEEPPPKPRNPWVMAAAGAVVGVVASAAIFLVMQTGGRPATVAATIPPAVAVSVPESQVVATAPRTIAMSPTVRPPAPAAPRPLASAPQLAIAPVRPPAVVATKEAAEASPVARQRPAAPTAANGSGIVVLAGPSDEDMITVWSNAPDGDAAAMLTVQQ